MVVENTVILLDMLWKRKIDFSLLEGHFEHSEFDSILLSNEPFIGVCSPDNPLAYKENHLHDLLHQKLILREIGSGTRDILEQTLYQQNLSVDDFNHKIEIGNMNMYKELRHRNLGITFMYREAVKSELDQGYLKKIPITDFNISHPFSFVYLKNSLNITDPYQCFNKIVTTRETLN